MQAPRFSVATMLSLPDPADPPEERLKQLEILRSLGALSEQEYERHRAEVLDEGLPSAFSLPPSGSYWTVHPPL